MTNRPPDYPTTRPLDQQPTDLILEILGLADELKTGLPDPSSFAKVKREFQEFVEALEVGQIEHVAEEAVDMTYYMIKTLHLLATMLGIDVTGLLRLTALKYSMRAREGNPKRKAEERAALRVLLDEERKKNKEV